jgi:SAM-dependent methyltransferase
VRAEAPGRLPTLLGYHQALLADVERNRAFARALRKRVRVGQRVLDLGAGSGVWAVLAARLGAREVVAVEREPLLQPVIERLAHENGVAARVRVVCGEALTLDLPRVFDLVISETVGHEGFDEGIVALLARARARFLRPGGHLLPQTLALEAAPARRVGRVAGRPAVPGLRLGSFAELLQHVPQVVPPAALRTLAPARRLVRVDLRQVPADYQCPPLRAHFDLRDPRRVEGLALWVTMGLAPGLELCTRRGTHWLPAFLPFETPPPDTQRLRIELRLDARGHQWQVSTRHGTQAHGTLLAYGALRAKIAVASE